MKKILETERLLLREFTTNDSQHFFELNQNPNVIKYTGDTAFANIEEAELFLKNYSDYQENGFGRWAVISKYQNCFLGWCGLKYNNRIDEVDIGFRFFESEWNKGYATESAKACIKYGFEILNLKKIIGRAMIVNKASIKVLEKIGLQYVRDFDFDSINKGVIYNIENDRKSN